MNILSVWSLDLVKGLVTEYYGTNGKRAIRRILTETLKRIKDGIWRIDNFSKTNA